jgi:hypothetical protein
MRLLLDPRAWISRLGKNGSSLGDISRIYELVVLFESVITDP